MKLKIKIPSIVLLITTISLCIIGCKKNNESKNTVWNIAPQIQLIAPNPPAPSDSPANIPAMVITEEGSNNVYKLTLNRIEGFEYVEGYQYKLQVKIQPIKDPPQDGHAETYKLIRLLSKIKVEN